MNKADKILGRIKASSDKIKAIEQEVKETEKELCFDYQDLTIWCLDNKELSLQVTEGARSCSVRLGRPAAIEMAKWILDMIEDKDGS